MRAITFTLQGPFSLLEADEIADSFLKAWRDELDRYTDDTVAIATEHCSVTTTITEETVVSDGRERQ